MELYQSAELSLQAVKHVARDYSLSPDIARRRNKDPQFLHGALNVI